MNNANLGEEAYLSLLSRVLYNGHDKTDRTGVGTRSIFGAQLRFNLQDGFPLLTTKKLFTKGIFGELVWLIRGGTNVKWLNDKGIHIWDEWADENGYLGPIYGKQWRRWGGNDRWGMAEPEFDQLASAIEMIKETPDSRRIIVNSWNVGELEEMRLPPCHMMFQFEVHDNLLSCHMYMRSADMFLGVPFNIASYAALTHVVAHFTGLRVGDLIISFGDTHIYNNHFDQVREQLSRRPRVFPKLEFKPDSTSLEGIRIENFRVVGYDPCPPIKAPVAV